MMERPSPQVLAPAAVGGGEEAPRPVQLPAVRARADERQLPGPREPRRVAAERGRVLLGREVPAAAPGLVAHAPEADVEGLALAVGRPLVGGRGAPRRRVAVFHPAPEVLRREAAHVGGHVGLGAGEAAEARELDGAELVGLEALRTVRRVRRPLAHVDPEVRPPRTARARARAVPPVVLVGEAAARPADDRSPDPPEVVHDLLAYAADVRDARALAHQDPV